MIRQVIDPGCGMATHSLSTRVTISLVLALGSSGRLNSETHCCASSVSHSIECARFGGAWAVCEVLFSVIKMF
jgi:hypothetical protein